MFISTELGQTLYPFVLYREEPGKLEEIVVLRELQTQFTIQRYSVSQEPEAPSPKNPKHPQVLAWSSSLSPYYCLPRAVCICSSTIFLMAGLKVWLKSRKMSTSQSEGVSADWSTSSQFID